MSFNYCESLKAEIQKTKYEIYCEIAIDWETGDNTGFRLCKPGDGFFFAGDRGLRLVITIMALTMQRKADKWIGPQTR